MKQLDISPIGTIQHLNTSTSFYSQRDFCELPDNINTDQQYISAIQVNGRIYKLRCEIAEVHPLICSKCGASLELHNGHGRCDYCGTNYSAIVSIVEV